MSGERFHRNDMNRLITLNLHLSLNYFMGNRLSAIVIVMRENSLCGSGRIDTFTHYFHILFLHIDFNFVGGM